MNISEVITMTKKKGRPSKYNSKIHDDLVYKLAKSNKTNDDIADLLSINRSTFYYWLNIYPDFSDSYKKGIKSKMDRVEQNIFSRCEWREVKEVVKTVFKGKKGKNVIKTKIEETTKLIPPDVGAMCFVLKTQRRDKWAEHQDKDINDSSLTINVAPATKKGKN